MSVLMVRGLRCAALVGSALLISTTASAIEARRDDAPPTADAAEMKRRAEEADWLAGLAERDLQDEPPSTVPAPPHPDFGEFAVWRKSKKGNATLNTVRLAARAMRELVETTGLLKEEKSRNDAAVVEPTFWRQPLFPEVSGAFMFVKILDHFAGEALFSANDGLFVLKLSPGDSFSAAPGQLVQMTCHNRGGSMLMSNGQRLPVFWSGSSPSDLRGSRGYQPNRRQERALEKKRKALIATLRKVLDLPSGPEEEPVLTESHHLRTPPLKSTVTLTFESDGRLTQVIIGDAEGQGVFCAGASISTCPVARAFVVLEDLLSEQKKVAAEAIPVDIATARSWGWVDPASAATAASLKTRGSAVTGLARDLQLSFVCASNGGTELPGIIIGAGPYARGSCGHSRDQSSEALSELKLSSKADALELRCRDLEGNWTDWGDAQAGCSAPALTGVDIRSKETAAVTYQLLCERRGRDDLDTCAEPSKAYIRSLSIVARRNVESPISTKGE